MKKTLILLLTLVLATGLIFANGVEETQTITDSTSEVSSGPQVFKISNGAKFVFTFITILTASSFGW